MNTLAAVHLGDTKAPRQCANTPGLADWIGVDVADATRTCSIEGCGGGGKIRRGWCSRHYEHWRTHGHPTVPHNRPRKKPGRTRPLEDRFWEKVDVEHPLRCWNWTAASKPEGYGKFYVDGHLKQAHRVAYELLMGSAIPDGFQLDHLCRNPRCVNPDHLEPVTQRENLLRGHVWLRDAARTRTTCPQGHPYDRRDNAGSRICTRCQRANARARYLRKKGPGHD